MHRRRAAAMVRCTQWLHRSMPRTRTGIPGLAITSAGNRATSCRRPERGMVEVIHAMRRRAHRPRAPVAKRKRHLREGMLVAGSDTIGAAMARSTLQGGTRSFQATRTTAACRNRLDGSRSRHATSGRNSFRPVAHHLLLAGEGVGISARLLRVARRSHPAPAVRSTGRVRRSPRRRSSLRRRRPR